MSIPTAVFLDTSVLDGQSYNFSSTALSTFVPACKHRNLKLLLPDPTEREIKRHMAELSADAIGLIDKARRTAPFLTNLKSFPPSDSRKSEASQVTLIAWTSFLNQFDVHRLDYDGIAIAKVMNWYDAAEAPFDRGKKRKEFPDAFAIAILSAYAEQNTCYIAVVSHDQDMKKACDRFPALMYFQSLPVLTELLLSEEDSRIATFRAVLDGCMEKLTEAAYQAADGLRFYHCNDYSNIDENEVTKLSIPDVRIVALGEHQCTIVFDAVITVRHQVDWFEPGPDRKAGFRSESIFSDYDISGTAKVSFDPKTNALIDFPYMVLNEEEIEVEDILARLALEGRL